MRFPVDLALLGSMKGSAGRSSILVRCSCEVAVEQERRLFSSVFSSPFLLAWIGSWGRRLKCARSREGGCFCVCVWLSLLYVGPLAQGRSAAESGGRQGNEAENEHLLNL